MTCYDCDFVRVVDCDVSVDEDEEICDDFGEG